MKKGTSLFLSALFLAGWLSAGVAHAEMQLPARAGFGVQKISSESGGAAENGAFVEPEETPKPTRKKTPKPTKKKSTPKPSKTPRETKTPKPTKTPDSDATQTPRPRRATPSLTPAALMPTEKPASSLINHSVVNALEQAPTSTPAASSEPLSLIEILGGSKESAAPVAYAGVRQSSLDSQLALTVGLVTFGFLLLIFALSMLISIQPGKRK